MAQREKGVTTIPCSTCDKELPAEDQPDGSVAAAACPTCSRKAEKAQKEEDTVSREQATNVKESDK